MIQHCSCNNAFGLDKEVQNLDKERLNPVNVVEQTHIPKANSDKKKKKTITFLFGRK